MESAQLDPVPERDRSQSSPLHALVATVLAGEAPDGANQFGSGSALAVFDLPDSELAVRNKRPELRSGESQGLAKQLEAKFRVQLNNTLVVGCGRSN